MVNGGDTYDYYYNEDWQLLEERKNDNANPLNQYVWNPDYIDSLALRYYDASTGGTQVRHWYLQDANYNVTAIVDDSADVLERYQYPPYGEVTFLDASFSVIGGGAIDNQHLYTGRERDVETGLQLNRNRYYAAHLGRWVNRDPIEYEGSPWNLYEYVSARVGNLVDSFGLWSMPPKYYEDQYYGWRLCRLGCPGKCSNAPAADLRQCLIDCEQNCERDFPDANAPDPGRDNTCKIRPHMCKSEMVASAAAGAACSTSQFACKRFKLFGCDLDADELCAVAKNKMDELEDCLKRNTW